VRPECLAGIGVRTARQIGGVRPVEDEDASPGCNRPDPGYQGGAIDPGQAWIDDDDVRGGFGSEADGAIGRSRGADDDAALADPKQAGKALANAVVRVDDEYAKGR
jgi:hypothetical protein